MQYLTPLAAHCFVSLHSCDIGFSLISTSTNSFATWGFNIRYSLGLGYSSLVPHLAKIHLLFGFQLQCPFSVEVFLDTHI